MEVVVLADSHLTGGLDALSTQLLDALAVADVVLHAGDVTSPRALAELESVTTAYAVLGNNDRALVGALPETRQLDLDGVSVAMVHDSGPRQGRPRRLHRRFPGIDLVVFGHSHVPINEMGEGGQLLFNPGSPTQRRSQPHRTFGRLRIARGVILHHDIEIVA
jgi:putative phosphoesterase